MTDTSNRLILLGCPGCGKTSISRVIFNQVGPHETTYLKPTRAIEVKVNPPNPIFKSLKVYDVGGASLNTIGDDDSLYDSVIHKTAFNFILFVIDVSRDDAGILNQITFCVSTLKKLWESLPTDENASKNFSFSVLLHKNDNSTTSDEDNHLFLRSISERVHMEISSEVAVDFYFTSIYDHSTHDSVSQILRKNQKQIYSNLIDEIVSKNNIEKACLIDLISKLNLASDSRPNSSLDIIYDTIDVVFELCVIYGSNNNEGLDASDVKSLTKLSNGQYLYLRGMSKYVLFVSILRDESLDQIYLFERNLNCLKDTLTRHLF